MTIAKKGNSQDRHITLDSDSDNPDRLITLDPDESPDQDLFAGSDDENPFADSNEAEEPAQPQLARQKLHFHQSKRACLVIAQEQGNKEREDKDKASRVSGRVRKMNPSYAAAIRAEQEDSQGRPLN